MKSVKTTRAGERKRIINLPGVDGNSIEFDVNGLCELPDEAADAAVSKSVSIIYANESDIPAVEEEIEENESQTQEVTETILEEEEITSEEEIEEESSEEVEGSEETDQSDEETGSEEEDDSASKEEQDKASLQEIVDKAESKEKAIEALREILIAGQVAGNKFAKTKDPSKLISLIIKENLL